MPACTMAEVGQSVQALAETLVAMANHRGGTLVLPLSTSAKARPKALIERILQAALTSEPPLILPMPQATAVDGAPAVVVTVPSGLPHVYALEGRYLTREGTRNRPLPPSQLRRLLLERGELSYEEQIVTGATLDDLDWVTVDAYVARLGAASARELMLRRGCIASYEGDMKPTNAGLLLFGKDPLRFVRGAHITAVRFAGLEMGDVFTRLDISGTLPNQIRRAETFLIDHLRKDVQLGAAMARAEQFEYPMEAAREVVVNAVAHRDYHIQGDGIRLFVFGNRLEVTSPGQLAGPVTLDNLAEERFSRNSIIVQVLSDLGFIERLGYGIDRIISLMGTHRLPAPHFAETAGGFRVTLHNSAEAPAVQAAHSAYPNLPMNPRQQSALEFLARHNRITNKDLQELYPTVHSETLRRDLADLVAKHILAKLGEKRGSYYVLLPARS